jgi:hypothetical protein
MGRAYPLKLASPVLSNKITLNGGGGLFVFLFCFLFHAKTKGPLNVGMKGTPSRGGSYIRKGGSHHTAVRRSQVSKRALRYCVLAFPQACTVRGVSV